MKFQELEIRNTKKCDCGHEFTLQDMTDLKRIDEHGFYGNIVKHFSYTKCPKCHKDRLLLLKQAGQTWEIVSIAVSKTENQVQNNVGKAINENNEENKNTLEFICSECKKVCKSQIGLNSHMKTHNN